MRRTHAPIASALVALALPLGLPGAARALPPGTPPAGLIRLGVSGSIAEASTFERRAHVRHSIRSVFLRMSAEPGRYRTMAGSLRAEARRGRVVMVHLSPPARTKGLNPAGRYTTRQLRNGILDRWLVRASTDINGSGAVVWIRLLGEMNGAWETYCAFNRDGTARPGYATRYYRDFFRRAVLILRGGRARTISNHLRRLGMRPLSRVPASTWIPRARRTAFVFNASGHSNPAVPGNGFRDYYPGGAYVDYVANNIFSWGGEFRSKRNGMNRVYEAFPTKRFLVAEWGFADSDSDSLAWWLVDWARRHPRTAALVLYQGRPGSRYDITSMPHALAAYRSIARERPFMRGNAYPVR